MNTLDRPLMEKLSRRKFETDGVSRVNGNKAENPFMLVVGKIVNKSCESSIRLFAKKVIGWFSHSSSGVKGKRQNDSSPADRHE